MTKNHAAELLSKLVGAIEQGKPHSALRRIIREGAPILHCNPPFETMSPESKGALVSIVTATQDMFKKPEAPTATPAQGQITREELIACMTEAYTRWFESGTNAVGFLVVLADAILHHLQGGQAATRYSDTGETTREVGQMELTQFLNTTTDDLVEKQAYTVNMLADALLTTFSITRKG